MRRSALPAASRPSAPAAAPASRAASILAASLVVALLAAAPAAAAPTSDTPAGAKAFSAVPVGNPPAPVGLESVLELAGTGPDAGVPRCLGPASFAHTSWAWVDPADRVRLVRVSATPVSPIPTTTSEPGVSTTTPDLAFFVQPTGATRASADVSEPQLCDGRETLGAPARTDANPEVAAVLPAGRPALVQVGWRSGDPQSRIVATLDARPVPSPAPAPAGDDPAGAPSVRASRSTTVPLAGATLADGDPAQPACQALATVWRRVRVAPGRYTATATGAAATLTAFADPITGDSALACRDAGDGARLSLAFRGTTTRTMWLRIGTDAGAAGAASRLTVTRGRSSALEARAAAADALAACTRRPAVLTDVRPRGRRTVRLAGAAGTAAAGKRVVLRLAGRRRAVATTRVRADGTFARTVSPGAAGRRGTARYVATIGRGRSAPVALRPRFAAPALRRSGTTRVTFRGRLTGPLGARRTVRLQRATCSAAQVRWRTGRTVRRGAGGAVSGTIARPRSAAAVVVRAVGTVPAGGARGRMVTVRTTPQAVGF